jgi:hypothetical protein
MEDCLPLSKYRYKIRRACNASDDMQGDTRDEKGVALLAMALLAQVFQVEELSQGHPPPRNHDFVANVPPHLLVRIGIFSVFQTLPTRSITGACAETSLPDPLERLDRRFHSHPPLWTRHPRQSLLRRELLVANSPPGANEQDVPLPELQSLRLSTRDELLLRDRMRQLRIKGLPLGQLPAIVVYQYPAANDSLLRICYDTISPAPTLCR